MATRRPASSPTTGIVRLTPGWTGVSPRIKTTFSRDSPVFKTAVLVDRPLDGLQAIEGFLEDWLDFDLLGPAVEHLSWLFKTNRKEATVVNREFLDWLSRRQQPERPFFAFLNYFDAHYPYEVPATGIHRFGVKPRNNRESTLIRDWMRLIQSRPSPYQISFGLDSYDDCVARPR